LQEAEELYDLREALEAFAVEQAIRHVEPDALHGLAGKLHLYGDDIQKQFTRERLIYDQEIHLEIARMSGNETLVKTLGQLFERIILKRRTDGIYHPSRGTAAHQEHMRLFEAMKQRDVAQAVALIRAHIRAGKDNVVTDLKQRQEMREITAIGSQI
jgi:DNA-binding GntR family transcriptional regulator